MARGLAHPDRVPRPAGTAGRLLLRRRGGRRLVSRALALRRLDLSGALGYALGAAASTTLVGATWKEWVRLPLDRTEVLALGLPAGLPRIPIVILERLRKSTSRRQDDDEITAATSWPRERAFPES